MNTTLCTTCEEPVVIAQNGRVLTCPIPGRDDCTDMTPCADCPHRETGGFAVRSGSQQRNTPADLAEDRGAANHLDERWLRP